MTKAMQQFSSECGKAMIFVENDMAIGIFHDFLMKIKGSMVDRMVAAHKEQEAQIESQKQQDTEISDAQE
jgi:hypothetical protein